MIDHQIILQKLRNYGIDHCSLKWFKSYFTGRTQKCKVNDQLSKSTSNCGIPKEVTWAHFCFLSVLTYQTVSTMPLLECLQMILV